MSQQEMNRKLKQFRNQGKVLMKEQWAQIMSDVDCFLDNESDCEDVYQGIVADYENFMDGVNDLYDIIHQG